MQIPAEQLPPLIKACHMLERSAPAVESLLDSFFPAAGWHPVPDGAGHVCLAEPNGASPRLAFRGAVVTLPMLVASLHRSVGLGVKNASARLTRQRPALSLALAMIRRPFDRTRQDMLWARMIPEAPALHLHDDATAFAIGLRLWTLHAWCLELSLAIVLSGHKLPAVLRETDRQLDEMLRPGALWLSTDLPGVPDQACCVARAPDECLPVGNLVFPNRLGARLLPSPRVAKTPHADDPDAAWLRWHGRFVEIPNAYLASRAKTPVFAARPLRLGHALC